jgi:hypothetical protein
VKLETGVQRKVRTGETAKFDTSCFAISQGNSFCELAAEVKANVKDEPD